jgi:hypothetical protein
MNELSRLYQAALEEQRLTRERLGDGWLDEDEQGILNHIEGEVEGCMRLLTIAWLEETLRRP